MLVVAPVGLSGASFPPVLDQVSLQLTAHLKTKTRTEARDFEMGCGWGVADRRTNCSTQLDDISDLTSPEGSTRRAGATS